MKKKILKVVLVVALVAVIVSSLGKLEIYHKSFSEYNSMRVFEGQQAEEIKFEA